jgi:hypothetical protein
MATSRPIRVLKMSFYENCHSERSEESHETLHFVQGDSSGFFNSLLWAIMPFSAQLIFLGRFATKKTCFSEKLFIGYADFFDLQLQAILATEGVDRGGDKDLGFFKRVIGMGAEIEADGIDRYRRILKSDFQVLALLSHGRNRAYTIMTKLENRLRVAHPERFEHLQVAQEFSIFVGEVELALGLKFGR